MSTLRTPNNTPMDENPDVDRTMHVESLSDHTLRPANDIPMDDPMMSMDTTIVPYGNIPETEEVAGD